MKNKYMTKLVSGMVLLLAFLAVSFLTRENTPAAQPQGESALVSRSSQATEAAAILPDGVEIQYTFRSEKLLSSHYEKHGAEFGEITKEEYLALANELIASPTALHKTEKEDGDNVFYDQEENRFLILSKDGFIRTFFRPDGGISYYERQ